MAGLGRKVFTRERATVADVNGYLMDQAVMVFASASARGTAIPAPSDGMVTYLLDMKRADVYEDGGWQPAFYGSLQLVRGTSNVSSDGSGNVVFTHNLGAVPGAVLITPTGGPVGHVAKPVMSAKSSTQVTVTTYRTDNGAVLADNPVPFDWVVHR